jgi:hypothetical protein
MENTQTEVAASSPAPFEVPTDAAANLEWRKTGEIPAAAKEAKTPKEASTPSEEDASAANTARTAPESAPGPKQERAKQPTAADRLNEVLADLKRAGLSPAELKTYKRQAEAATEAPAKAAPEKTVNPQEPQEPKEPVQADYDDWEKFDVDHKKYVKEYAQYVAKLAVQEDRQARAAEAQQQTLAQKVTEAKARYGDQTEETIGEATRAILNKETGVPLLLEHFINQSKVLVDVMYVLGSKDGEVAAFIELARSDPGAAIRKFTLMEQLVEQELAKGGKTAAADEGTAAAERDASGKFVSQDPPAKKKPAAPPPPEELNTRGSAPPDPVDAAVRNNDFAAFKAAEDRADIARRKGAS